MSLFHFLTFIYPQEIMQYLKLRRPYLEKKSYRIIEAVNTVLTFEETLSFQKQSHCLLQG